MILRWLTNSRNDQGIQCVLSSFAVAHEGYTQFWNITCSKIQVLV